MDQGLYIGTQQAHYEEWDWIYEAHAVHEASRHAKIKTHLWWCVLQLYLYGA